ncbi:MAG: tetratricopeptide repeat protein [Rickettsiales bacterium]
MREKYYLNDILDGVEKNDPKKLYDAAVVIYEGRELLTRKNSHKAAEYLKKAAVKGHEPSHALLYEIHKVGDGVEQNKEEAFRHLKEAVKSGALVSYELKLARHYYIGDMTEVNYEEAFKIFSKIREKEGVESENGIAATNAIAEMYRLGQHVEKDYQKHLDLKCEVAESGQVGIQYGLARAFYNGNPEMAPDFSRAIYWFAKSLDSIGGNTLNDKKALADSYISLGDIYSTEGKYFSPVKAIEHYEKSANVIPSNKVLLILAREYMYGNVVDRDEVKALNYINLAASGEDVKALVLKALLVASGKMEVEGDFYDRIFEAQNLLSKAKEVGDLLVNAESINDLAVTLLTKLKESIKKGVFTMSDLEVQEETEEVLGEAMAESEEVLESANIALEEPVTEVVKEESDEAVAEEEESEVLESEAADSEEEVSSEDKSAEHPAVEVAEEVVEAMEAAAAEVVEAVESDDAMEDESVSDEEVSEEGASSEVEEASATEEVNSEDESEEHPAVEVAEEVAAVMEAAVAEVVEAVESDDAMEDESVSDETVSEEEGEVAEEQSEEVASSESEDLVEESNDSSEEDSNDKEATHIAVQEAAVEATGEVSINPDSE